MNETLIVGGTPYEVIEVEVIDNDPMIWGQTVYEKHQLLIKQGLDDVRKRQTIIHELLHAIFFESGYAEHEEEIVNRLGITLSAIKLVKENDTPETGMSDSELISFGF